MNLIFLISSILISMLFFYLMNPISLGLMLIIQTISLSLFLGTMKSSFWFMYILMLIFIGGMLVLFIYVTSIFPNEKFNFNQKEILVLFVILGSFIVMMLLYNLYFNLYLNMNTLFLNFNPSENMMIYYTSKMFCSQTNFMLVFMVNYLFYCMIVVIKITNFFKGPLRLMKYV